MIKRDILLHNAKDHKIKTISEINFKYGLATLHSSLLEIRCLMDAIFWSNLRLLLMQHTGHPYSAFMSSPYELLVKVVTYYKLTNTLSWWGHSSAVKAPAAMLLGPVGGLGSPR